MKEKQKQKIRKGVVKMNIYICICINNILSFIYMCYNLMYLYNVFLVIYICI